MAKPGEPCEHRLGEARIDFELATLGVQPRRVDRRLRRLEGDQLAGGFGRPSAVWRMPDGALVPASDARSGGVAALD